MIYPRIVRNLRSRGRTVSTELKIKLVSFLDSFTRRIIVRNGD